MAFLRCSLVAASLAGVLLVLAFIPLYRFSRRSQTVSNLKTLSMALHSYHETFGCFPPAVVPAADGRAVHSWRALVIPQIWDDFEGVAAFKTEYRFDEAWDGPHNRQLLKTNWFGDRTQYLAVIGEETVWPPNGCRSLGDVRDATGSTILLVEFPQSERRWLEPGDLSLDGQDLFLIDTKTKHRVSIAGCNVVMVDGSVGRLHPKISNEQIRALLTIEGREEWFNPWTLERP
jgi:hypothetical protein